MLARPLRLASLRQATVLPALAVLLIQPPHLRLASPRQATAHPALAALLMLPPRPRLAVASLQQATELLHLTVLRHREWKQNVPPGWLRQSDLDHF